MGCAGCSVKTKDGTPQGCRSNGSCGTSGCNRLNTYDWLATQEIVDVNPYDIIEVSFKNGSRKGFYINQPYLNAVTGDMVVVEGQNGYDVGRISLSGDLVRLQMKKKRVKEDHVVHKVLRHANPRDLEKLDYARSQEIPTMIRARAIARSLDIDMKIGDVEYQGDNRKATFYYTAEGRIDFRELIRMFAKDFRVKIEMRQIGARQESGKIGGIGSCGRELCCSTWLSDFKSVSTAAARYQNLAINQAKLSGQCGRLKCCLNYELDSYMDALQAFPKNVDKLKTKAGVAVLVKTDIFKGIMYFAYQNEGRLGKFYALEVAQVRLIKEMNIKNEFPLDLVGLQIIQEEPPAELDFESVNDVIELPPEERRRRRGGKGNSRSNRKGEKPSERKERSGQPEAREAKPDAKKAEEKRPGNRRNRNKKGNQRDERQDRPNQPDNKRSEQKQENRRSDNPRNKNPKPGNKEASGSNQDKPKNEQSRDNRSGDNKSRSRNRNRNRTDNRQADKPENPKKPTGNNQPPKSEPRTDKSATPKNQQQTAQNKPAEKPKPTPKPNNPPANKSAAPPPNQPNQAAKKPADQPAEKKTSEATNSKATPKQPTNESNAAKLDRLNRKKNKNNRNKR